MYKVSKLCIKCQKGSKKCFVAETDSSGGQSSALQQLAHDADNTSKRNNYEIKCYFSDRDEGKLYDRHAM